MVPVVPGPQGLKSSHAPLQSPIPFSVQYATHDGLSVNAGAGHPPPDAVFIRVHVHVPLLQDFSAQSGQGGSVPQPPEGADSFHVNVAISHQDVDVGGEPGQLPPPVVIVFSSHCAVAVLHSYH